MTRRKDGTGMDGHNMKMIFGPDGAITRSGGITFTPGGSYQDLGGGITHGPHGPITQCGDISFLAHGGSISRTGNMWYASNGSYNLVGSTLYGPGGKIWQNVSPEDVPMLIDGSM